MSNLDGRYKLYRWRYCPLNQQYEQVGIERYRTKAEAKKAYARAYAEDGAAPDLHDTETEEYIA